jgi:4-alpha-glucanotransferase
MPNQKLVLGIRNSLPVGTTAQEFEEAYQRVYKPFMTLLYNHPGVYMGAYYSGNLLEWLESSHPEFMMLLNDMSKRKQIELLGGVHYEAFLPLIPNPDRLGQIEFLTTFIRKRFGRRPRGGILPGDVWEPSLASTLKSAGFDYTFLPDSYFANAGCRGKELYSPCFTEDLGKNIIVYPVSTGLSGRIGKIDPATFVDELSLIYRNTGSAIICLYLNPEGPQEWYDLFFSLLEERNDEISSFRPVRAAQTLTKLPKRYFSSVTFQSMMRWIERPTGEDQNYLDASVLPSGSYRHFLTRYPEGNALYSKMMYTSLLVNQIRGDRSRKKTAREELWKAQCNAAYWHGRNGGIYRRAYRQAAYSSLLESEKITKERGIFKPSIFITDFDMDGNQEYLYRGININAYIHPQGGSVIELDYFPTCWNYCATMARHEELYLQENAQCDVHPRNSFVDHIYEQPVGEKELLNNGLTDTVDFSQTIFTETSLNRDNREVSLSAEVVARLKDGDLPLRLSKSYLFRKNTVILQYTLEASSEVRREFTFSTELNLAFSSADILKADSVSGEDGGQVLSLEDSGIKSRLTLSCDRGFEWSAVPMIIPYLTEEGIVEEYQQHVLMLSWKVAVSSAEPWNGTVQVKIDKL